MKHRNPFVDNFKKAQDELQVQMQIEVFVNSNSSLRKTLNSWKLRDYPSLQLSNIDELQAGLDTDIEIITVAPISLANEILSVIATDEEQREYKLKQWLIPPFLCLFFIICAVATGKWRLLSGLALYPISLFTAHITFLMMPLFWASLLSIPILLFTTTAWTISIPLGFILFASNKIAHVKFYRKLILQRATTMEAAFLFLMAIDAISVYRYEDETPRRLSLESDEI